MGLLYRRVNLSPKRPIGPRRAPGWAGVLEFALKAAPQDWVGYARALFGLGDSAVPLVVSDPSRGSVRIAFMEDGRLVAALFGGRKPVALSRAWLVDQIGQNTDARILSGQPGGDIPDPGATVCACFNVGVNTIRQAIEAEGFLDVAQIGEALQAGTNCGSCRPELKALIEAAARPLAAE